MANTKKQLEPEPPHELLEEETLVLFILDANAPPIDDDVFDNASEYLISDLPEKILFGNWKVLRVPDPETLRAVVEELKKWGALQYHPDALRIMKIFEMADVPANAYVICLQERPKAKRVESGQVGGKEFRVGQTFSPEEFDEFQRALISGNPGPFTIRNVDSSTGFSTAVRVDNWSDFEEGPVTNKAVFEHQISDLQEKGYLAFDKQVDSKFELKTPYKALIPQYFRDFSKFIRHQDIPSRYFQSTNSAPTLFVSHRWESTNHPDPTGIQFQIMRKSALEVDQKLIWYDYSCLPQEPRTLSEHELFKQSLHDLNSFLRVTQFFSIIDGNYINRAWCYYEWVISKLLTGGQRISIQDKEINVSDYDKLAEQLVLDGVYPKLDLTLEEDRQYINNLLLTGVGMFKTLSLQATLSVLNDFGFTFGLGIASRFAQEIDFGQFWRIWQVLAGSSNHSGISLPHLLDHSRLANILKERHERFDTHARFFKEIESLSKIPLDLRIVEEASHNHLFTLLVNARRLGPAPAAYTTLALIRLLYSFAGYRGRESK